MAIYSKFNSRWSTKNGDAYVGKVFVQDEIKHPEDVFHSADKESVLNILNMINGFWGAVVTDGNRSAWIASDRIRSYPVFYAHKGEDLFISSDASWVREQCCITEINIDSEKEFLMTGYVTSNDTLFVGLKQIQQGEVVFFEWSDNIGKYTFSSCRYYRYLHKDSDEASEQILMQKLDHAMLASFNRLIKFADSRTIIIPLSGGYDSRLVALMLKRLGYDNLIAYTYGVKNNEEAIISREIADTLKIPWFFVEYTQEKWYEMYHSEEYISYEIYAGGLASLPHIQDLIAVTELKQKNLIPKESIFVPGLSADLLAGSRSSSVPMIYKNEALLNNAIDSIITYHYSNNKSILTSSVKKRIFDRIHIMIGNKNQYINAASLFESFDVSERQTKYINNSVRVYEFCGYKWWTPFWDKDFFDFWSEVPLIQRVGKKLYDKYVVMQSKKMYLFPGSERYRDKRKMTLRSYIGKLCSKVLPSSIFMFLRDITRPNFIINYTNHPMAWYGCWTAQEIENHIRLGNVNIFSMLSFEYLKRINDIKKL